MVKTQNIKVKTKGNCDIVDITAQVNDAINQSGISSGTVTVFNVGSTAGVTTTEYEPGPAPPAQELDETTKKALKSLGYVD